MVRVGWALVAGDVGAPRRPSNATSWFWGGGESGTRGRHIRLVVRVRSRQEAREVEPAEEVPKERRAEVWSKWLAEGRYRSAAEVARACGVSRETVSAVLRDRAPATAGTDAAQRVAD